MLRTRFAIEKDGPERIHIQWRRGMMHPQASASIFFDGTPVGEFESREEWLKGKTFSLPDGSPLRLIWDGRVQIYRNGELISNIVHSKPIVVWTGNYLILVGVGVLIFSLLAWRGNSKDIQHLVNLAVWLPAGLLLLPLGLLVRHKPILALFAAMLIWSTICIMAILQVESLTQQISWGLLCLSGTIQGYTAMHVIRSPKHTQR